MKIKKINDKVNLEEQFDVELQYFLNTYWCDCDCGQKFPKRAKSQIKDLVNLYSGSGYVFKNPTAAQKAAGKELCREAGLTYCYVTGTKKTTGFL